MQLTSTLTPDSEVNVPVSNAVLVYKCSVVELLHTCRLLSSIIAKGLFRKIPPLGNSSGVLFVKAHQQKQLKRIIAFPLLRSPCTHTLQQRRIILRC